MRFIHRVHRMLLWLYPAACILMLVAGLFAQPRRGEEQSRLDTLETAITDNRLAVEHRLTALETDLSGLTWLVRASLGGIAGLLVEAAFRLNKKRERLL